MNLLSVKVAGFGTSVQLCCLVGCMKWRKVKRIAVRGNHHTATGNHIPYGITQCYLPPGSGDFLAFSPADADTRFSDPGGMQGWVDLGGGYIPR